MTTNDELKILRLENELLTNIYMTKCRVCEQLLKLIAAQEEEIRDGRDRHQR